MSTTSELHEVTSEAELDSLVNATLADAGVELGDLRRQAHEGRFASERQRRAWFVIEGLGRG